MEGVLSLYKQGITFQIQKYSHSAQSTVILLHRELMKRVWELTGLKKKPVTLSWTGGNCSTVEISGLDIGWGQRIPLKYDEKKESWILQRDLPEGSYEYKYVVDGEWLTNKHELVTSANKDGHINNYVQVRDKDPESVSAALWNRLTCEDFDLTKEERVAIRQFLDACPEDEE